MGWTLGFPEIKETWNADACGIFRYFPFVYIVLEEFDYTARVQHALAAVERK